MRRKAAPDITQHVQWHARPVALHPRQKSGPPMRFQQLADGATAYAVPVGLLKGGAPAG